LATGTDYWVCTYNGDSNNNPVSTSDTALPVAVLLATPIVSVIAQPASLPVGSAFVANCTVSGGYQPSGNVTISIYDTSSANDVSSF